MFRGNIFFTQNKTHNTNKLRTIQTLPYLTWIYVGGKWAGLRRVVFGGGPSWFGLFFSVNFSYRYSRKLPVVGAALVLPDRRVSCRVARMSMYHGWGRYIT